ncbi:MAG: hypothetical protein NXI31_13250 [bacterium]|nr:hypothetical protein [bacterium]
MRLRALDLLPAAATVGGAALVVVAACDYPGGYRWLEDTFSALFAPATASGADNPARPLAVAGACVVLAGMALLFHRIATTAESAAHEKMIRIGGIGAMVYAALTVTPMHDLMVTMALGFYVVALGALLHLLVREGRTVLFGVGVLVLVPKLVNATMYYLEFGLEWLPLIQKVSTVATLLWLVVTQVALRRAN